MLLVPVTPVPALTTSDSGPPGEKLKLTSDAITNAVGPVPESVFAVRSMFLAISASTPLLVLMTGVAPLAAVWPIPPAVPLNPTA